MAADRWVEVERLFHEAQQLAPGDRAAFVASIVDQDIRSEISSLLATGSDAGSVVEAVIGEAAKVALETPATGSVLSHFRIVRAIGRGAMGEVYLADDLTLGRQVALKLLPRAFQQDRDRAQRFEREARAAAALNHPNIMAVYEVGHSGDQPFIAAEYVEGETLADRLSRGPLPEAEAIQLAEQIAEALAAAHEKGVIHCDLKPANIKITPDGTVKVLDFGLAKAPKALDAAGNSETTSAGLIVGTAVYMSPEQARGAHVDRRTDIWAFGVVIYETLTGKRPFQGATITDTLAAVIKDEPDLLPLTARLRPVIGRCLNKDLRKRWHDIGDVRIAFEEVVSEPARPRSRGWWTLAAAALTASLIAAIVLLRPSGKPVLQPLIRLSVDLGPEASLNNDRGQHSFSISPDGTRIAFACAASSGETRICTRRLDQAQPVALAGTEGVQTIFFSPDGKWIGFTAPGKLRKVFAEGGAPITLCNAPFPRGASWGENGFIIASLDSSEGLSRIPENGGTPQLITQLKPGERRHRWPQVLPGTNAVLFTASAEPGQYENASLEIVSLKTGERKTLHRGGYHGRYLPGGRLIYMHQGTLFAARMDLDRLALTSPPTPVIEDVASRPGDGGADFDFSQSGIFVYLSSRFSGRTTVQWLHKSGRLEHLMQEAGAYDWIRLAPDGKQLALIEHRASRDIWVYDLERETLSRITFAGVNDMAIWSPDGKHIAYAASGQGEGLWWARADGSGERQRLSETFWSIYSFSPDGRRLATLGRSADTSMDIWTLPVEGPYRDRPQLGTPEPFLRTPASEGLPAFSPDGRWLAYVSDESGVSQIYVSPFPGAGGRWQISTDGGTNPIWSRNARELFYISNGRRIMVSPYNDKDGVFVAEKPVPWCDFQTIAPPALPFFSSIIDLAPDGRRFAVLVLANMESQKAPTHVNVLLNFSDELRRKIDSDR